MLSLPPDPYAMSVPPYILSASPFHQPSALPYIMSVPLLSCLFPLIYCNSPNLYTVHPSSYTVDPILIYCLARPPPLIQNYALKDVSEIILSNFTSLIVNKYDSQCLRILRFKMAIKLDK